MTHTPLNDMSGYWGDEEVDFYRDQVFLYTDQVIAGVLKVREVPQEYIEDVADRVFYEKTGRRSAINAHLCREDKLEQVEKILATGLVDMSTHHCLPNGKSCTVHVSNH